MSDDQLGPPPSARQLAAWDRLWRRLLIDVHDEDTDDPSPDSSTTPMDRREDIDDAYDS